MADASMFRFNVSDGDSGSDSTPVSQSVPTSRARSRAYSRATTGRPKTSTHYSEAFREPAVTWLVAVIEARADTRVIGLACLSIEHAQIYLCEIQGDSSTYAKATHALAHRMPADAILLPQSAVTRRAQATNDNGDFGQEGFGGSKASPSTEAILTNVLAEAFPDTELVPVLRKYWDAEAGLDLVRSLALDDDNKHALVKSVESKYVLLPIVICCLVAF